MQTLNAQQIGHILQFVQQQDAPFYKEKKLTTKHLFGKKQGQFLFLFPSLTVTCQMHLPKNYPSMLSLVKNVVLAIKRENNCYMAADMFDKMRQVTCVEFDNCVVQDENKSIIFAKLFQQECNVTRLVAKLHHRRDYYKELVTAALAVPTLKHLELRLAQHDDLSKNMKFVLPAVETMILENALFQFDAPVVKKLVLYFCDLAKLMQMPLVGNLEHLELNECVCVPDLVELKNLAKLKYLKLNNGCIFVKRDSKWNAMCDYVHNIDASSTATTAILEANSKNQLNSYPNITHLIINSKSVSFSLIDCFPNITRVTLKAPYASFPNQFATQVQHLIIDGHVTSDALVPFAHVNRIDFCNNANVHMTKLLTTALTFNIPTITMHARSINKEDVPFVQTMRHLNRVSIDYTWLQELLEKEKEKDEESYDDGADDMFSLF